MLHSSRSFLVFMVLLIMTFAFPLTLAAQDDMGEANKATFHRIIEEAFHQGNLDIMDEAFSANYVQHTPDGDIDLEDFKAFILALRAAMPDLEVVNELLIAEDDWIAVRGRVEGTFENPLATGEEGVAIPPTGQRVSWTVNVIHRFDQEGRDAEDWVETDNLSFLIQLGVIPAPEEMPEMMIGVAEQGEPSANADPEANKEAVNRLVAEAFGQGNLAVIDEVFAADYVNYDAGGVMFGGIEEFKGVVSALRDAIPDLEASNDILVAEGDWVAFRFVMNGTFENEMVFPDGNIPPTGEPLTFTANIFIRFNEDGQAVEEWDEFDNLGFLMALGAIPPMEDTMMD